MAVRSVRDIVVKCSEGRVERVSTCGMKRMVGISSFAVPVPVPLLSAVLLAVGASFSCRSASIVGVGPITVAALDLVISLLLTGSGAADSRVVDVVLVTFGNHPLSPSRKPWILSTLS